MVARAAIVLCAGKSTRMRSAQSKMLQPICGKPLCFWPIDAAIDLGAAPVVAVVGHMGDELKQRIQQNYGDRVQIVWQQEQNGTANAVLAAMEALQAFQGQVMVLCGDVPLLKSSTLESLANLTAEQEAEVGMLTARLENPTGYGRVVRREDGALVEVVEERDATDPQKSIQEVNAGVYVWDAEFLRSQLPQVDSQNTKGEFYLTDLIAVAADRKKAVSLETDRTQVQGVNNFVELARAESDMRGQIVHNWMLSGVYFADPLSAYVDAAVELSPDVRVGPHVVLKGTTRVGAGTEIGAGVVLTDCIVEDQVHILPYSVCEQAHIGTASQVGPFARLRKDAFLEDGVRVGNFVEVKNTRLKKGAKSNHLAYLGDAVVGERSNVGAGTITCNYDGTNKHKTIIDDGVFIGSNSTLVAPLHIGESAYVGAGSTITKDVPAGALAIGRARQENKIGYASRIRSSAMLSIKRTRGESPT